MGKKIATKTAQGRFFVIFNVGERQDVKVVKAPKKPTATWFPQPAYAEGPFKTKFDVIKRLNQMDIPASKRPEGYQAINMARLPSAAKDVPSEAQKRMVWDKVYKRNQKLTPQEEKIFAEALATQQELERSPLFAKKSSSKKKPAKIAGDTWPSKVKLNKFVLSMAYEKDYNGLDFVPAGTIKGILKGLKIPREKWGEFLEKVQEKSIFKKVEVPPSSGMTRPFNSNDFQDDKYSDDDWVYLNGGIDDLYEYRGPRGAFNTLGEKGKYILWLENIREWAGSEFGHFVEIPIEKFVGNEANPTAVTEKENETFAKQAYKDGYLLKSGKMLEKYKLPFVVADEKIWMLLHKSTAFS